MQVKTRIITDEVGNTETRYFAETEDGFDGAAHGFGYKSKEKLEKAYWFYKNRDKINNRKNKANKFLKENPQIKKILDEYFSAPNYLYAFKDGEELTMKSLLQMLEEENKLEIIRKLNENQDIWGDLYARKCKE